MTPGSLLTAAAGFAAVPPLTREGAREAARREVSKAVYAQDSPPLVLRVFQEVGRQVDRLLSAAASLGPGGAIGAVLLVALLLGVVVAVRLQFGPLARAGAEPGPLEMDRPKSAAEHRSAADAAARAGRHADALRERLRAVSRDLEDRGVLSPRSSRTAEELAAEAGAALTAGGVELRAAARAFDEVWYGGREARPPDDELGRRADATVSAASLRVMEPVGSAQ